jgi:hypothetical protein
MCAATDIGVHAASGLSGVTVKPPASMTTYTGSEPPRGIAAVVHRPAHSTVFAACHAGPGGNPRIKASAATIDVSVARPANITSAPARIAAPTGRSTPLLGRCCR